MDEVQPEAQSAAPEETKKMSPMVGVGVIIVFAVLGIGVFMTQKGGAQSESATTPTTAPEVEVISTGTESGTTVGAVITVEGGNFKFTPSEIKVKKGDTVKILFKNMEGFHDFVIDEFAVKTAQIGEGKTEEVSFVADKVGTFEYYCSVGKHRAMGMKGNLVVE